MMSGPKRRNPSILLPLLVCLSLAGLVYLESAAAPRLTDAVVPVVAEPVAVAALPPAIALEPPPASAFDGVLARPLFAPSRRPPPDAPAPQVDAVPEAAPFEIELVGVAIAGDERRALVRQPGLPVGVWVETGAAIGGWTVEAIEPDHVLFRSGTRLEEARLRDDTPPPVVRPSREERREEARRRRAQEREEAREEALRREEIDAPPEEP